MLIKQLLLANLLGHYSLKALMLTRSCNPLCHGDEWIISTCPLDPMLQTRVNDMCDGPCYFTSKLLG